MNGYRYPGPLTRSPDRPIPQFPNDPPIPPRPDLAEPK